MDPRTLLLKNYVRRAAGLNNVYPPYDSCFLTALVLSLGMDRDQTFQVSFIMRSFTRNKADSGFKPYFI